MKVRVAFETVESVTQPERDAMDVLANEIKKSRGDAKWSERAPSDRSPDPTPEFRITWTEQAKNEYEAAKAAEALVLKLAAAAHITLPRLRSRADPTK